MGRNFLIKNVKNFVIKNGKEFVIKIRMTFLINNGIKNGKDILLKMGSFFFNVKWEGIFSIWNGRNYLIESGK